MLRIKSTRKEPIKKFNISLFLSLFHHKKVEMKGKICLALITFFLAFFLVFLLSFLYVRQSQAQIANPEVAQPSTSSGASIIGEFQEDYYSERIKYEEPFNLELYPSTVKINLTERSLTIDGRFRVNGTVPAGNKYFGFSFNAELSDGDLWYRDYGSNDAPVHLQPSDFNYIKSYETPIGNFSDVYYTVFPKIPVGTDKEFRLRFVFAEKPKTFIMYFGTNSTIISSTITTPFYPNQRAICRDSQNIIHLIWLKNTTAIYYANSTNGITWRINTTFRGATSTATSTKYEPSISCDGNNITVAYADIIADDVIIGISTNNGATWSWSNPVSDCVGASKSTLVERRGQRIYAIYKTAENAECSYGDIKFFNSSDGGNTWSSPTILWNGIGCGVSTTYTCYYYPSLAVDGTGSNNDRIHVAVRTSNNVGEDYIYYRNSTNSGTSWNTQATIASSVDTPAYESTSITYYGSNVYVAFFASDVNDIYFANSTDYGTTWTSAYRLDTIGDATNRAKFPSVTLSVTTGHPVVFWQQDNTTANRENIVYRNFDGTKWNPDCTGVGCVYNVTTNFLQHQYVNTKYYAGNCIELVWRNGTASPYSIMYEAIGTCIDTTPPTYSLNSTNSTTAGTAVSHNLYWQDNVGLSGYIFSFCNGTWNGTHCLATTTVLLLPNSTDNLAWKMTDDVTCPASPESATTAFADADYNKTNVSDANYFSQTASCAASDTTGDCIYSKYSFNVTKVNTTGPITSIVYCIKGYYHCLGSCVMQNFWRNTTGWHANSSQTFGTTPDYTYCIARTSNIDSYIMSDGTFQVAVFAIAQGDTIEAAQTIGYIDIVNVTVTYTNGWINDTWQSMSGIGNWSNVTKTVNSTIGATIAWCVYANDTSNNWNGTSCQNPFSYVTTSAEDTVSPTYSLNSTNSTLAGTSVSHNLFWQDNAGLAYAVFSFDNCTGTLENITGMSLSGTSVWSNFTVGINSTVGCTIRWRVYANDTSNNWNTSDIYSYETTWGKCSVLDIPGKIYKMGADIIDSTTSYCMNISANNVTLDCQGHTIDGDDVADYGIYVYRSAATTTNITIKNCVLTDWDTVNIYLRYANNNVLENISSTSSPDYGLYFDSSNSNTLTNITANSNYNGLYLDYYSNSNTLTDITSNSNSNYGLRLYSSDSNTLTDITSNSNSYGLYLYDSDSTKIQDSTFKDNSAWDVSFFTDSDWKQEFINVIGTEDKPIVYYNTSVTIENWYNNVSEIILGNADNSTLKNITMDRTGTENNGILLVDTDYSNLTDIKVIDLEYGIYLLKGSNNNRIENITSNSNSYGLYFDSSNSNTLTNITANSNNRGLYLHYYSNSNTLTNITSNFNSNYGLYLDYYSDSNTLTDITSNSNSYYGLYLDDSDSNTIKNSKIQNNTNYGIYLTTTGSTGANLIYNNLFNNTNNFYIGGTIYTNNWNTTRQTGDRIYSNGTEIGGNYWTNSTGNGYSDTCTDANQDGFCDSYYELSATGPNRDYLPLSDEGLAAWLEVNLVSPPLTYNAIQNQTFTVNATVTCRGGNCGSVNGTVEFNFTSKYPNTPINTTQGDKPFYIQEPPYPSKAMKVCSVDPLNGDGQMCYVNWTVNATGDINSVWLIGVYLNSSAGLKNYTSNATVTITTCSEYISLGWNVTNFTALNPNTNWNEAPGNAGRLYNITNTGTCTLTLWIKGVNLVNATNPQNMILVGNLSWNNVTNDYTTSYNLTTNYAYLNGSFAPNKNLTTYYWLSVPPVYAGEYNGNITFCGNYSSFC